MKSAKLWIVVFLTLAAVSAAAIVLWNHVSSGGHIARIYQDGVCIRELDLNRLDAPTTFSVETGTGGWNTVEAEPGRIRIRQADCPDQVCVRQGWISDASVPIVCLPNRLVIQIEGGGDALDAATG